MINDNNILDLFLKSPLRLLQVASFFICWFSQSRCAEPWAARRAAQVCLEAHLRGFPHPNTYLRRWVCCAGNSNTEKWRLKWKYSSWNIVRYEFCWIRWKRNNWIHVVLVVKYVKKTPILGTSFNFFNFFLLCTPFVLCEPLTIYIWQLCGGKRVKI